MATKNSGKVFEEDFKNSVPNGVFYQRIKDDTMKFKNVHNVCDAIMYTFPNLILLELKSTKAVSMPFGNLKVEQVSGLVDHANRHGVIAGFIFNYRKQGRTFFVGATYVKKYIETATRKSFPMDWVENVGTEIHGIIKRTRFWYDLRLFISQLTFRKGM